MDAKNKRMLIIFIAVDTIVVGAILTYFLLRG
jgi:uncharacterized membrane protein